MLLQVHDELVFEVPEAETEATRTLVAAEMSAVAKLSVPLTVDTGIGERLGRRALRPPRGRRERAGALVVGRN